MPLPVCCPPPEARAQIARAFFVLASATASTPMKRNGQVLVLNQNYEPLNVCSWRRAVVLIYVGKAMVLEDRPQLLH